MLIKFKEYSERADHYSLARRIIKGWPEWKKRVSIGIRKISGSKFPYCDPPNKEKRDQDVRKN